MHTVDLSTAGDQTLRWRVPVLRFACATVCSILCSLPHDENENFLCEGSFRVRIEDYHMIASFRKLVSLLDFPSIWSKSIVWRPVRNTGFQSTASHPEVESVPGLFLRVDAIGLGPADCPDVGLMALFKVDELEEDIRTVIKMHIMRSCDALN